MAHFAKIENNVVTQIIVIPDDKEANGQDFINNVLGLPGIWLQTSYNTHEGKHLLGGIPLRKNYAGVGYIYNSTLDAFIPPKPFDSWTLNEDTCVWEAPAEYPTDGKFYDWDEESLSWTALK